MVGDMAGMANFESAERGAEVRSAVGLAMKSYGMVWSNATLGAIVAAPSALAASSRVGT
jgi:hypothetical protein